MEGESKDVSSIQDEDVLRRMWQQTEDFGRKKEIRSHMYKLREARLKEFYSSGEVLKDVQRSNSSPGLRVSHSKSSQWIEGPTHADSLADHSFLSLKSKEIRDSESPTRDVQFKNTKNRVADSGWTISTNYEKSNDGKNVTNTCIASTQGTRPVEGGEMSYAATSEQYSNIHNDGDSNQFTKSASEGSKTFSQQNITTGDENNYRTAKTSSSNSSSSKVIHHSSTSGVLDDSRSQLQSRPQSGNLIDIDTSNQQVVEGKTSQVSSSTSKFVAHSSTSESNVQSGSVEGNKSTSTIVKKTETGDTRMPDEIKKGLADGTTKVTTETKTLPDGSTVTTTRYETKGAKKWSSSAGSSSSAQVTASRQVMEEKSSSTSSDSKQVQYTSSSGDQNNMERNVTVRKIDDKPYQQDYSVGSTSSAQVTTNQQVMEEKSSSTSSDSKQVQYTSSSGDQNNMERNVLVRKIDDKPYQQDDVNKTESIRIIKSERMHGDLNASKTQENVQNECKITQQTEKFINEQNQKVTSKQDRRDDKQTTHELVKVTTNETSPRATKPEEIHTNVTSKTIVTTKQVDDKKLSHGDSTPLPEKKPVHKEPEPKPESTHPPQQNEMTKSAKPKETPYKPSVPTDDQYTTTYRQEYTNKRISVDISPTHDAFARSLRSISPERISDRPKSRGTSTSSGRSSASPEKVIHAYDDYKYASRVSPERKSPSKKISPERKSPDRKSYVEITTDDVTKKKIKSGGSDSSPVRSPSPSKSSTIIATKQTYRASPSPVRSPSPSKSSTIITTKQTYRASPGPDSSPVRSPSPSKSSTIITTKQTYRASPSPVRSPSPSKSSTIITTKQTYRASPSPVRSPSPSKSSTIITTKQTERSSPVRSPTKQSEITTTINTDTITRKKKTPSRDVTDSEIKNVSENVIQSGTLTKKKVQTSTNIDEKITKKIKISSRDSSPTSTASDIEFINHNRHLVTDLDEPEIRPTTLNITTTETKQKSDSVYSEIPKPKQKSPTKSKDQMSVKRNETYEERCRQILGLNESGTPKEPIIDYTDQKPVEEPLFVKKHVVPTCPEDDLIHETIKKISKAHPKKRPERPDLTEFITAEQIESEIEKPEDLQKKPEGDYLTEYTDEYYKKQAKSTKKQPTEKKHPTDELDNREFITEYVDEYCDDKTERKSVATKKPEEQKISKVIDKNEFIIRPTDRVEKKSRKSPEKSTPKKQPKDEESSTDEEIEIVTLTKEDKKLKLSESDVIKKSITSIQTSEKKVTPERKEPEKKKPEKFEGKDVILKETIKITVDAEDQIISKSPERKQPAKKKPEEKIESSVQKITTEQKKEHIDKKTVTDQKEKINKKSPERITPERKQPQQKKPVEKEPEDREFDTEYSTEYSETSKATETVLKKTSDKKEPQKKKEIEDRDFGTEYIDKYCEITDDQKLSKEKILKSTTEKGAADKKEQQKKKKPVTDDQKLKTETEIITFDIKSTPVTKRLDSSTLDYTDEEYNRKVEKEEANIDFITREKYDTDTTLEVTKKFTKPEDRFEIEHEYPQEPHIRTHRVDTIISTTDEVRRESSPKRQPQKAMPSDTIECTFNKDKIKKKSEVVEDRKSSKKENRKDSISKSTTTKVTTTNISSKKTSVTETKHRSLEDKRKHSVDEKVLKQKQIRSPSPNQKSSKTFIEISKKKIPDKTPLKLLENPVRKSSPERKIITISPKSIESNKKHLVTKTVALTKPKQTSPKTITTVKTTKITHPTSLTITTVKTTKTTKILKPKKIKTDSSETETDSEVINENKIRADKKKVITTANIKLTSPVNKFKRPSPSRDKPVISIHDVLKKKPEALTSKTRIDKSTKRCITTKSIVLNNKINGHEQVVIDLQRSTSSREPSPDKICPIPVSSEDETGHPRYPDQVSEPEETPIKPRLQKLIDIPLTEEEDVHEFNRITEVTSKITDVDRVNEEDESLLSVNEKVSRFFTTTDDQPRKTMKPSVPKTTRPVIVTEDLENDECLLSVSDKVNKFVTTAEQMTKHNERASSPPKPIQKTKIEVDDDDECLLTVNQKVSHFIQAAETVKQKPIGKAPRSEFTTQLDETLKSDDCLLSVSDKVSKFLTTAETKPKESSPRRQTSPEKSKPETKKSSPKPTRHQPIESNQIDLKSSEAVRKAKAMFENISKTQDTTKQRDIITRPSVWEGRKKPTQEQDVKLTDIGVYKKKEKEVRKQLTYSSDEEKDLSLKKITSETKTEQYDIPGYMKPIPKITQEERDKHVIEIRSKSSEREIPLHNKPVESESDSDSESNSKPVTKPKYPDYDELPGYMRPLQRHLSPERDYKKSVPKEVEETIETTPQPSPEPPMPGYMRPLQRHAPSPDRESGRVVTEKRVQECEEVIEDEAPRAAKKFGVNLRRTDSGRLISTSVSERRRSSVPGQPVIEDIFDLDLLEKMMDKVVGYEQRRRIRAQIRLVRHLISENKIQYEKKRTTKQTSPVREPHERRSPTKTTTSTTTESKSKSKFHHTVQEKQESHSEYKSSYTKHDVRSRSSKERSLSPEIRKKQTTDEKPSWITNRNLKKTVTEVTEEKRRPVKKETIRRSPSPQKTNKSIDSVTSSYGIGPTDENGQPLFGIRALRKAGTDKVHVRGTVVTSQFYSENGKEPVGEVTVTKYSNRPKELLQSDDEQITKAKGFASVTTTQKFGTRGSSPTRKTIIDNKKKSSSSITDKQNEREEEILKTTSSTKVTRRGSVKALSQKFIENAVEISRNERQTYPKAGLILRTSSFKETSDRKSSSRESSPGYQDQGQSKKISLESLTCDSRNEDTIRSHKQSEQTKTFLNSNTRVTNTQDVITRMKNAENERKNGDTNEDREARTLLNKFIGAQVLLSGMDPTSSSQLVRKVQKTKTITTSSSSYKDSGKPLTLTKQIQGPITAEALEDIWDEQTLKLLLEQCTNYEERRIIRARLRQVMAEQEAVANVVADAVADKDDRTSSIQERVETTKKTFTEGPTTTTEVSTRTISSSRQVNKPMSPFAKFRQLDKQNSLNTPPSSPRTPMGGGSGAPLFKFTDPALSHSASTVKDRLLHWCQMKTKEYKNIKLENFSTCWADGLAFCALIHHFLPDAFDYDALTPQQRRHNFTLAFKVADEQADIAPLLDVDDMVAMKRPDWKCVFTYVQSIYRRFKDED